MITVQPSYSVYFTGKLSYQLRPPPRCWEARILVLRLEHPKNGVKKLEEQPIPKDLENMIGRLLAVPAGEIKNRHGRLSSAGIRIRIRGTTACFRSRNR
jgi:hypothetical protein